MTMKLFDIRVQQPSKSDMLRLPAFAESTNAEERLIACKYTTNETLLRSFMYDFNADCRLTALQRVKDVDDEIINEYLTDEVDTIRVQLAMRLPKDKLYLLANDKSVFVRCMCATLADQDLLVKMLDDENRGVRGEVCKRIDSTYLLRCLRDKDDYVRDIARKRLKK